MSDNMHDILKLKSADQTASSGAPANTTVIAIFDASGFVSFLNVLGWITILSGIICILSYSSNDSSYERLTSVVSSVVSIGSAMSLFISAHVIKTIEKCAFYLENLNKKN
jgi:hypothetical protein